MKKSLLTIGVVSALMLGTNISSAHAHTTKTHKHTQVVHHHKAKTKHVVHHVKPVVKIKHHNYVYVPAKKYVRAHTPSLFSFIFKI